MKIALLLGISEHDDAKYNLPACRNDVDYMYKAIQDTSKFDSILKISEKLPSIKIKERITDFIDKVKDNSIDEVFFYFSGHGNFDGDEFNFILSDYKKSQHKQTSLENSELDNWLKSVDPKLIIKVVDACNAGVQYVKDPQLFEKYLEDSNKRFNNCYFMFSSLNNQSSVADDKISHFTKSFLLALTTNANETIRYKDIIDYISDDFENNPSQTPYFLIQATNTEKFGSVSESLRKSINDFINVNNTISDSSTKPEAESLSIIDLVKKDSMIYCNKEDLLSRLDLLKEEVVNYAYPVEIVELYDMQSSFNETYSPSFKNMKQIGQWLNDNANKYFAQVFWTDESYYVPVNDAFAALSKMTGDEPKKIKKYMKVISGIKLTQDVPYKAIEILGKPKYENLDHCGFLLLFIFSKTHIRFFYSFVSFKQLNWNDIKIQDELKWNTQECQLKNIDELKKAIKEILIQFSNYILEPVTKKYKNDDVN